MFVGVCEGVCVCVRERERERERERKVQDLVRRCECEGVCAYCEICTVYKHRRVHSLVLRCRG